MNMKKNILIVITILMLCAFSLVSCNIMFFSEKDATEASAASTESGDPKTEDPSTSDNCVTTAKPSDDQTTTPTTTTTPPVTAPSIENGGEVSNPGYGPIGDPVA